MLCLILFSFLAGTAKSQSLKKIKMTDTVSIEDKLYGLSTLWKEASYNFVWFDKQPGLKWDSVYQSYIPKVLKAKNVFEVNRVYTKFLEQLKDGHTAVWVNQSFWDQIDQAPISITRFQGKLVVYKLDDKLKDVLPIKSEILKINNREAEEFLREDSWLGFRDTEIDIFYKKPNGETAIVKVKRNLNVLAKQSGFKYYPASATTPSPKFSHQTLSGDIALVKINTFSDSSVVDSFKKVFPLLQQQKALILDLRNNGGGNSDYALAIAKCITDKPYLVGPSWRTKTNNAAKKAWGSFNRLRSKTPDYQYKEDIEMNAWEYHPGDTVLANSKELKLNKQVIILTSKNTYSAAEDFLIYLLGSKNIVRIGQASAGSSGQPITIDLPSIGMSARICAKRDMLPDGTDYIGKGILPDIEIPVKSIFSIDEKDYELEAALSFLKKK